MIQPYQDLQDRISKAINLGGWKFSSQISRVDLEEEEMKSGSTKRVRSANTQLMYCTLKAFPLM